MKITIISIIFSLALIFGVIFLGNKGGDGSGANNVTIENGVQIIQIDAKGGYFPRKSIAKAGIPTVIKFNTKGTFDCSAAVIIPSLGISKVLPQSGTTEIDIGVQKTAVLKGSCGMGMYPFEINFEG